jgi:hypothetical protein
MQKETQISAIVSETTKELMEKHVRATGVKKGHLVEEALRHHLLALQELPREVILSSRIVVTRESWDKVVNELRSKRPPTKALRDLLSGDGD